jgi:hypothetical protein
MLFGNRKRGCWARITKVLWVKITVVVERRAKEFDRKE